MPVGEDHEGSPDFRAFPLPLREPMLGQRRTPAEEARTIVESARVGSLATLSERGAPWASLVGYGVMADGSLSLVVSTLAEHGRNLVREARASVSVAAAVPEGAAPLDVGRVTLAGTVEEPLEEDGGAVLASHVEAYPAAGAYARYTDFSVYRLRVERVRWVGGFGRMDSVSAEDYAAAVPDPVDGPGAHHAVTHLNDDHADALLLIAQRLAGYTDATAARCERVDRHGLDLRVRTPRGSAPARVGWLTPAYAVSDLRARSVELLRCAQAIAVS